MKIANTELNDIISDNSAYEFRDNIVEQLEKCVKTPFAMNSESEFQQIGEQKVLREIIEYLKYVIWQY